MLVAMGVDNVGRKKFVRTDTVMIVLIETNVRWARLRVAPRCSDNRGRESRAFEVCGVNLERLSNRGGLTPPIYGTTKEAWSTEQNPNPPLDHPDGRRPTYEPPAVDHKPSAQPKFSRHERLGYSDDPSPE
jgi:hypothetical protein